MASETKFWHEHLRDVVRAMDVLDKMTKELNVDNGVSDLEFMVPTQVGVMIYGQPVFHLVLEDEAWYMVDHEEIEVPF